MPKVAFNIEKLRDAVRHNKYLLRQHVRQRMVERGVTEEDIEQVVTKGDVVEQQPRSKPFPKAVFMAFVRGDPLYVAAAFDGDWTHIITVHWYDPTKWVTPWERRK